MTRPMRTTRRSERSRCVDNENRKGGYALGHGRETISARGLPPGRAFWVAPLGPAGECREKETHSLAPDIPLYLARPQVFLLTAFNHQCGCRQHEPMHAQTMSFQSRLLLPCL